MTIILDATQIEHKIRRIAYQIYEANIHQERFILAGIAENGYILAEKLYEQLQQFCPIRHQSQTQDLHVHPQRLGLIYWQSAE